MNTNMNHAINNLELEMLNVRCMRQLYHAIVEYFEICFMQKINKSKFNVRGVELYVEFDESDGIEITYEGRDQHDQSFTIEAEEVIDLRLNMAAVQKIITFARQDEKSELVSDAMYWLFEKMKEYFRVMGK